MQGHLFASSVRFWTVRASIVDATNTSDHAVVSLPKVPTCPPALEEQSSIWRTAFSTCRSHLMSRRNRNSSWLMDANENSGLTTQDSMFQERKSCHTLDAMGSPHKETGRHVLATTLFHVFCVSESNRALFSSWVGHRLLVAPAVCGCWCYRCLS